MENALEQRALKEVLTTLSSGSLILYRLILNPFISDLFNNAEKTCQPACKIVNDGAYDLYEKCRIVVGYDDLLHNTGSITVTTQKGRFWDFTCSRKLTGEASGDGAVNGTVEEETPEEKMVETDFSIDLTCCDPADKKCKQVSFFVYKLSSISIFSVKHPTKLLSST